MADDYSPQHRKQYMGNYNHTKANQAPSCDVKCPTSSTTVFLKYTHKNTLFNINNITALYFITISSADSGDLSLA